MNCVGIATEPTALLNAFHNRMPVISNDNAARTA